MPTTRSQSTVVVFATLVATMFILNAPTAAAEARTGHAATTQPARKLALHIVKAKNLTIQKPITGTGTIFAHKTSMIGPLVQGQIINVLVNVGDRVKKAQALFEIRPHTYKYRHDEAIAQVKRAEAVVNEAQLALKRSARLIKHKNISEATHDKNKRTVQVAQADLEMAKVGRKRAKRNLDDTIVYAPFEGVVTARYKDEGIYLSTLLTGNGGNAVVELQKIDIVLAIVQIPAREVEHMRSGAPAKLYIDGISKPVDAKITIINYKIDVTTRAAEVRIVIPNKDYTIKPGLFVRAEIMPKSRTAIVLPRQVVLGPVSSPYVYIYENGKAVRKSVNIADLDALRVEIISGLKNSEPILAGPDLKHLSNGVRIGELSDVAG